MATVRSRVPPADLTKPLLNLPRSPRSCLRNDRTTGEDARWAGDGLRPRFEGLAWSLAQVAPLNVRPPVLPPATLTMHEARLVAQSPLDTRSAWAARPAHVCQREPGQLIN